MKLVSTQGTQCCWLRSCKLHHHRFEEVANYKYDYNIIIRFEPAPTLFNWNKQMQVFSNDGANPHPQRSMFSLLFFSLRRWPIFPDLCQSDTSARPSNRFILLNKEYGLFIALRHFQNTKHLRRDKSKDINGIIIWGFSNSLR